MKTILSFATVFAIIALDQWTKSLVEARVELFQEIPLLGGLLTLTHIRNEGAAYNLFTGFPLLLVLLPATVLLAGLAYIAMRSRTTSPILLTAASFVIGGGAGNLLDRLTQGYVTDFFDIHIIPVFNVADMFITTGCGLLILYFLFYDGKWHESRRSG